MTRAKQLDVVVRPTKTKKDCFNNNMKNLFCKVVDF
jgi:hypothetical protein